jgi:hypothetical protein
LVPAVTIAADPVAAGPLSVAPATAPLMRFLPFPAGALRSVVMAPPVRISRPEDRSARVPVELPTPPAGAVGSAGAGFASSGAGALAILFVFLVVLCLRYGRVVLTPVRWRPVLFVSLLERPG